MREEDSFVLQDALVICRDGLVEAAGNWKQLRHRLQCPERDVLDLGRCTLMPGLVNAHTHVNLSHAAGKTVSGRGFVSWVKSLVKLLRTAPDEAVLHRAMDELAGCGTVLAADIAGFHARRTAAAFASSAVQWLPVVEFIGPGKSMRWPAELSEGVFTRYALRGISGHALYSTSGELLQKAKTWATDMDLPFVMHLAESPDESEMFVLGSGEMLGFYTRAGFVSPHFSPPGMSPVAFAHSLGLLDENTLAVHCAQADAEDMALLASSGSAVCLCPRSNEYIGVGRAPWQKFFAMRLPLCIGTDGLCSNTSLNLFDELRFMAANWRGGNARFPWQQALEAVTRTPARLLRAGHRYGTIAPGCCARLTVLPEDISSRVQSSLS
jgi:cytosine/adenosine deaminase-related metal-dependent hydrolase